MPAVSAATGCSFHDTSPLVLLDRMELLLSDHVGVIEIGATATVAGVGAQVVLLRLEMLGYGLAAGRFTRLVVLLLFRKWRGHGPVVEGVLGGIIEFGGRQRRLRRLPPGTALLAVGDRQQLRDPFVAGGDGLREAADLRGEFRDARVGLRQLRSQDVVQLTWDRAFVVAFVHNQTGSCEIFGVQNFGEFPPSRVPAVPVGPTGAEVDALE